MNRKFLGKVVAGIGSLLSLPSAVWAVADMPGGPANNQLNLREGVTTISAGQMEIHTLVMWICVGIGVVVFGAMFYSIIRHRKDAGFKPATFHESTSVEIFWTIIPLIIVTWIGIAATDQVIAQKDTGNADVTIKATGYQWKWGYDYLKGEGEGIQFLSQLSTPRAQIEGREEKSLTYLTEVDNHVVVPVNKKVRVVLTANDVIHSWYVPAFGVKQDAIPGFVRDLWFKAEKVGTYRGYCAELCGKDHAFMPIVVDVKSAEDYTAWVNKQLAQIAENAVDPDKEWSLAELTSAGKKAYKANCAACHQAAGTGIPGAFPALKDSPIVLGDPAEQIKIMLLGRAGTAMSSFKQLSNEDLAAIMTYTRNAFGNKAEQGIVQPKAFAAAR